jgi:hypothetical protein
VTALYGAFYNPQTGQGYVTKSVVNGRIVWTSACDPSNSTSITGIPRNDGEGLLCYILRILTVYNPTTYAQTDGNGTQVITETNFTNSVWTGGTITNPSGLDKFDVGLSNVDNTADVNKPISGPQATYVTNAITAALTGFVPLSVQSLAGGTAFSVPYQAAPSVTAFLPIGAAGLVLTSNGAGVAPSWQTSANVNTNANNIVGGPGTNRILIQTSPGVTGFLGSPTTDAVLKGNGPGTPPSWSAKAPQAVAADTAALATSVSGGLVGDLLYQSAAGVTSFIAVGTANQVLGGGTIPGWQNVDTAATNDTIVKRTATGAVNASGFVGATFSGNSATASALTAVPGLSPGTYGSATGYPIVTVNNGGQITGVSVQNAPAQPTVFRFPEVKPGEIGFGISDMSAFIDSQFNIRVTGTQNVNAVFQGRLGLGEDVTSLNAPGFMIATAEWLSGERPDKVYLSPRNMYVLTNLGNIYSCGQNGVGQLGHSGTTRVDRLVRIPTLTNVVDFAVNVSQSNGVAGDNVTFCLACTSSGSLFGWGYNIQGQLGNSTTSNVTTGPVQITANGFGSRLVTKVFCNGFIGSSWVIVNNAGNNELWASGGNNYGQLGINSVLNVNIFTRCVDDSLNPMVADEVYSAGAWDTAATTNETSTYALSAGSVFAVGGNTGGQLGQGNTASRQSFKLVTGIGASVASLSLSSPLNNNGNSVAARTSGGALWVWGNNSSGQLAIGTTANQLTPTLASGLAGLTVQQVQFCGAQNAVAVGTGATRMHVLTTDGNLRTAGCPGRGFGNGVNITAAQTAFVRAVQNGVQFAEFRCFGSQSVETILCRGTDGNLYSFGYNNPIVAAGLPTGANFVNLPQKVSFY